MMDTDFGLDSLAAELESGSTVVAELLVHQISPDPEQPRKNIDPEKLQQLADSIKAQGVIQPIVVRNGEVFDSYIIIAGEQRWRASQIAGRATIPAVVRDISLTEIIAAQIIENIDREGFSLLDEVRAVLRMCDICGSAKAAGEALGKSKAWISQRVKIGTVGGIIETFIEGGDSTDVMGTYQLARFTEKHPEEGRQFIDSWIQHPESRGSLREKVAELFLQMDRPNPSPASNDWRLWITVADDLKAGIKACFPVDKRFGDDNIKSLSERPRRRKLQCLPSPILALLNQCWEIVTTDVKLTHRIN